MVDDWWKSNKINYSTKSEKTGILSRIVIVNWLNRFLFAHYLKKHFDKAWDVEKIDEETTVDEALSIFEEVSSACDFYNIFARSFSDDCVDEYSWKALNEFNKYLKTVEIDSISQDNLKSLLVNVISISQREIAGQYCTPVPLARLLVELTMLDANGIVLDPCCGTGTIPKEATIIKKERGVGKPSDSVWASDKFAYPLSLASISLANPDDIQSPIQVFKGDVFDLKTGQTVSLSDPKKGEKINRPLPQFDVIVSNLPFVRFEDAEKTNPNVRKMGLDDKRSDLYAYIVLNLSNLLGDNGQVGVIVSNSWLATNWGQQFRKELLKQYEIQRVLISQSGRWFSEVDVVSTIIIMKKRTKPLSEDETIQFVSIAERIEHWDNQIMNGIITDIILNKSDSEHVYIHNHSLKEISIINENGFGRTSLFSNMSWAPSLNGKIRKVSSLFDIARGERRGWDQLFYPKEESGIEEEFLKPVLSSSKEIKTLIAEPDGVAFCCSRGIAYLEQNGKRGALKWIQSFIDKTNGTGAPLTESLKRSNMEWYEMSASTVADMAISINPDGRLIVFKLKERSFVNQRLIRLTTKKNVDVDLCHALMNTTLGMLFIESQGFGRGLGVLDLNTSKMKENMTMLDPSLLNEKQVSKIKTAFSKLLSRSSKELPDELKEKDRQEFDRIALNCYGIESIQGFISNTLLELYRIRKAVVVNKTILKRVLTQVIFINPQSPCFVSLARSPAGRHAPDRSAGSAARVFARRPADTVVFHVDRQTRVSNDFLPIPDGTVAILPIRRAFQTIADATQRGRCAIILDLRAVFGGF